MSTHCVLGTIVGAGNRAENKQTNTFPHQAYYVYVFSTFI